MNYLNKNLFYFCIVLSVLLGCQSQKANIRDTHKITMDKWKGLASYAKSDLNNYPVYIASSFSLIDKDNKKDILVNNFQLTNRVSQTQIDLLNPTFKNKLICNPTCYFFNEYNVKNSIVSNTLVSDLFEKYEFKLFHFYSQLFLLNDQIQLLEELDKQKFSLYLQSIVFKTKKHESLKVLAKYLQNELTVDKYKEFLNDPKRLVTAMSNSHINETHILENKLWSAESTPEIMLWMNTETPLFNGIPSSPIIYTESVDSDANTKLLQDFDIGDTVCTSYNSLGIIEKIEGKLIFIDEVAIAQVHIDGILGDAQKNILRYKSKDFNFIPFENKVSLSSDEIFSCEIQ